MAAVVAACIDALEDGVILFQSEIDEKLSQPGSGIQYPGKPARSSAPGQPPAAQDGTLKRSWTLEAWKPPPVVASDAVILTIGSNQPYADRLEKGDAIIAKRPYVAPVLASVKPQVDKLVGRAIKSALGKFDGGR